MGWSAEEAASKGNNTRRPQSCPFSIAMDDLIAYGINIMIYTARDNDIFGKCTSHEIDKYV